MPIQIDPDKYELPYGRPFDWDDLTLDQKWMIFEHQLHTLRWWRRVLFKPVVG